MLIGIFVIRSRQTRDFANPDYCANSDSKMAANELADLRLRVRAGLRGSSNTFCTVRACYSGLSH